MTEKKKSPMSIKEKGLIIVLAVRSSLQPATIKRLQAAVCRFVCRVSFHSDDCHLETIVPSNTSNAAIPPVDPKHADRMARANEARACSAITTRVDTVSQIRVVSIPILLLLRSCCVDERCWTLTKPQDITIHGELKSFRTPFHPSTRSV